MHSGDAEGVETDGGAAAGEHPADDAERTEGDVDVRESEPDRAETVGSLPGTDLDGLERGGLPYIFARRTVKADREALPVYVREEAGRGVAELERRLDDRFDGDELMSLDVREALLRAGLRNTDDVVAVLRAWGYGRR
ncbi:hypothetical protein ACFQE1_16990 [Halobium palmae]|uniref:Uncharacterized protein n=1 Tax=Halobium palmae TaxID=1776492 RepID=A0ABD5S4P9_9EURY